MGQGWTVFLEHHLAEVWHDMVANPQPNQAARSGFRLYARKATQLGSHCVALVVLSDFNGLQRRSEAEPPG